MKNSLPVSEQRLLLFSIFILSLCGITYELVLGSLATYLLGNPVQQYSITIGFFLSSMGLGSYLSRYITKDLLRNFILIEIVLGFVGGFSIILLSFLFSFSKAYYLIHIFFLIVIGTLVGLEIPLLTRILKQYGALKDILSNVLSLDYLGGLAGSLLFPILLYPLMGRMLTSLVIGAVNIAIALLIIIKISYNNKKKYDILVPLISLIVLITLSVNSNIFTNIIKKRYYDDVIFSKRSKYQEILLTRSDDDFRLFLDGALQFSSYDEHRYHEMLIFPVLALTRAQKKQVLLLGGGDGLAVRELLKDPTVAGITVIELDGEIIKLAKTNSSLKRLNQNALLNPKVTIFVQDAYHYLMNSNKKYDIIIADFPDPHDETIAKLYTIEFYMMVRRALHNDGFFVTQSTSPYFATKAFWCIHKTLSAVFPTVTPYHIYIPSFGDWGFNIAGKRKYILHKKTYSFKPVKYFSKNSFFNALYFTKDIKKVPTKINNFNRPLLYQYYLEGWKHKVEN